MALLFTCGRDMPDGIVIIGCVRGGRTFSREPVGQAYASG
jgi:hypothetical protein